MANEPVRLAADFVSLYERYSEKVKKLVTDRFQEFKYRHLTYEFLLLPFRSVEEFRGEFYRLLRGERPK